MSWEREVAATLDPGRPVLIAGPTASGKSDLALAVAEAQGRTVVNADALQVYARWRVLTARPGAEDEVRAPHALYGHLAHDAPWSVGHWLRAVEAFLAQQPPPVIVGGTGLYFTALTGGLAPVPDIPAPLRTAAVERLRARGLGSLVSDLDAPTRARIDTANPARVLRAWEVLQATGRGLADWQAETAAPLIPAATAQCCVLELPREPLAARIEARFDAMMAAGALDEVRTELPRWDPAQTSSRAIGAAELVAHLRGAVDLPTAVAAAKAATRRYAKRQRTWMRNRLAAWPRLTPPG